MLNAELQGGKIALSDVESARHYPASNTAATQTLGALTLKRYVVAKVMWSYSAAPTGGRLTITDGGTTIFDVDIIAGGPGTISLMIPTNVNSEVIVTLAAGGVGITGKLQFYYLIRSN